MKYNGVDRQLRWVIGSTPNDHIWDNIIIVCNRADDLEENPKNYDLIECVIVSVVISQCIRSIII